ncbi:hypothetical protein JOD43_003102 [Pullulanibacillus pueri]|uniref:Raffinose synthase n=1 Tax=Pullulanibacillus pueri TaxID=1437324 RepID=A0A8J2ZXP1_9BACL|nr:Sip1-related alpha-galactosidase [Pullulanibacillus pueri]MBM7682923.1 hypothetical protein [Pullulanibacillus pueri]GGH84776.1 hypothetical protein GCM10007096_28640 [Pullulanibacillus pueri]
MTSLNQANSVHLMLAGEEILKAINLSVKLDNQETIHLDYSHVIESYEHDAYGEYSEFNHHFSDPNQKVALILRLKEYENITLGYVELTLSNERVQSRHHYLAPEESIIMNVRSLGHMKGLLANYQHKDWWTRPYFSKELSTLPERTQSLLWQTDSGYYYLLPVTDQEYTTRLVGADQGFDIRLSSYAGGYDRCETLAFALGKGKDPFALSESVVTSIIEHLGFPTLPRKRKRYPKTLDYLGWCSWDAFYHEVNEKGLLEKMDELKEKHLPVKWVMIDDGWLDVENDRLKSFEADKNKFPQGLSSVTQKLKDHYAVNSVGVWHTIAGYWGGIQPESELATKYHEALYQTNSHKLVPHPNADKGFKFWNHWHTLLKQQGIDFIKVDSQSAINNFFMFEKPIGQVASGIHTALEASAGLHFDQCMINCMGMASENIWHRPISSLSRNSDDFVPGEEISFKEHALQNVYNSYYHGQFYWGDWDMFWSKHEEAVQNAVLRAVSGGPVYFSDKVGDTDPSVIRPLIYKNGQILRADQPGLPTEDCLFVNPNEEKVPLKVWNTINNAGIMAAFNIHLENEPVQGTLCPSDLPTLQGEKYVVYDYFSGQVQVISADEKIAFTLEKEGVALYILLPLAEEVIPIGNVDKFLSPGTVNQCYSLADRTIVELKEGGTFKFYYEGIVEQVLINSEPVNVTLAEEHLFVVDCTHSEEAVAIEIITG